MKRPRYAPLSPGHDAPLGALDLFEIYTLTILLACVGWFTTLTSAQASLKANCPKRYASLQFHGMAALLVAAVVDLTLTVIHYL